MRIGLDIGGTKIDAVAIDANGAVAHRLRLPTGFGASEVVTSATAAVQGLADLAGIPLHTFRSIGVGIPGVVDPANGRVSHAVNLGFADVDFGSALAVRTGLAVAVENDVNAAALGAYHALSLRDSMAYLNLGTGLASGLVVDGQLWRGARGAAGEIGHIPIDPAGALCPCGQRGCLETVASGSAIARLWPTSPTHPLETYPAAALFSAADRGDARALSVRASLATGVASAVRLLVLSSDVDRVVIGGGLSNLGDALLSDVTRVLVDWSGGSPFLASLGLPSRVQLLPPDLPVAAVGAAMAGAPSPGISLATDAHR